MESSPINQSSPAESDADVLVTIVVPVFNTPSELIDRAVFSALNQTHSDLELLIVNDGSSTETAEFLDHLAEGDPRTRVVHKANGGVSAARNVGVQSAVGEFITYLDADDYLEPGFLTAALTVARTADADVVFGGIRVLHGGGAVEWRTGGPPANTPLLGTPEVIITACVRALADSPSPRHPTQLLSVTNVLSSLYRTSLARRHLFPEGVAHAEDRLHNVQVLLNASCVMFCSDSWYVYDTTYEQGATRRATPRTIMDLSRTVREFAGVEAQLRVLSELSADAHDRIGQAAADGVLNYLKVLTGVMATIGEASTNRTLLRHLVAEPSVSAATAKARKWGWQDQVFAGAARHGRIGFLLLLGWLWVRTGGLPMSVERPGRSLGGRKKNNG